jgi:hypothetical protein
MRLQIPFIVALAVMGILVVVFVAWTFGPIVSSHRWQDKFDGDRH